MPRAAILTFDECYASSVGGFADILQIANSHLRRQQGAATQVQLSHTRTGPRRWSPPPVSHGHRERPAGALERSQLTREVLEAWCADARETLLYEVSEQVVVQK